jgi:hypothetical protein
VAGERWHYYVATTGSDAHPGTKSEPFRTIGHGASVLTPGATLYVMGGTYAEALHDAIPGGTSWSQPVTVAAYPGQIVTLRPNPGAERVVHFEGTTTAYIVVEGFILDATNVAYDAVKITYGNPGDAAHHIRLKDCEVKNARNQGILVTPGSNGNEFIDLDVHDNGTTDFNHGVYLSSEGNLVDGSTIHRNAGWGVHVYYANASTAHRNVIRNNAIFDNARVGGRGSGIILSSGTGNVAYGNDVWGNNGGIQIGSGALNAKVSENSIFRNSGHGVFVRLGSIGARVEGNIIYQNDGLPIQDNGFGTVREGNWLGGEAARERFIDVLYRLQRADLSG